MIYGKDEFAKAAANYATTGSRETGPAVETIPPNIQAATGYLSAIYNDIESAVGRLEDNAGRLWGQEPGGVGSNLNQAGGVSVSNGEVERLGGIIESISRLLPRLNNAIHRHECL